MQAGDSSGSLLGHKERPGREVSDRRSKQLAASSRRPLPLAAAGAPNSPLESVSETTPRGGSATTRDEREPSASATAQPAGVPSTADLEAQLLTA